MSDSTASKLFRCECGGTAEIRYGAALQSVFVQCERCGKHTNVHSFKRCQEIQPCIIAAENEWNTMISEGRKKGEYI